MRLAARTHRTIAMGRQMLIDAISFGRIQISRLSQSRSMVSFMAINVIKISILLILEMTVSACSNAQIFQPPPPVYMQWKNNNSSPSDTKKAMLECGYPNPYGSSGIRDMNRIVTMHLCMEGSGYRYEDGRGSFCQGFKIKPDACLSNLKAPARDVTKRLNGQYCKINPGVDECK